MDPRPWAAKLVFALPDPLTDEQGVFLARRIGGLTHYPPTVVLRATSSLGPNALLPKLQEYADQMFGRVGVRATLREVHITPAPSDTHPKNETPLRGT